MVGDKEQDARLSRGGYVGVALIPRCDGGLARLDTVTIFSNAIRHLEQRNSSMYFSAAGAMAERAAKIAESSPLAARGEHNSDGRLPLVQK